MFGFKVFMIFLFLLRKSIIFIYKYYPFMGLIVMFSFSCPFYSNLRRYSLNLRLPVESTVGGVPAKVIKTI